eukprot:CAMPEP_0116031846 /NCGR_PEP_ID=MMETSP0321-20121206/17798_1 /TAXON_ID=163516 /ORGANISM="Leptocylindrus danicus var. danicus, Strain B650" /LENGTH=503 /DNA_ID=CAMNT_0003507131 /DNA_START=321 /DNA_END=1833 /DNA_ORIENTATION=+
MGQQAAFLPNKEIKAEARPATGAGGLARLNTQSKISGQPGGYGRQVQDTSYFVGLLSNKINAITTEIDKLRTESENIVTESKHDKKLEWKAKKLATEVQLLEDSLADYNLAADKGRSGETEERIRTKAPEKLHQYLELLETRRRCQQEMQRKIEGLNKLRQQLQAAQSRLNSNRYRIEYTQEERNNELLAKALQQARERIEISKLGPKDAHERILIKVKEVQVQTKEFDRNSFEVKAAIQRLKDEKQRLLIELNELETISHNFESKNHRILETDNEMTKVLSTFESEKTKFLEKQVIMQSNIAALLDFISQGIKMSTEDLPSKERLKEVKNEVTFKAKQLETSQQTTMRLQDQKMKRIQELEKIDSLEDKIELELPQLQTQINSMKAKIVEFEDVNGFKARAAVDKENLICAIDLLEEKHTSIQQQIHKAALELEETEENIKQSNIHDELVKQRQKLVLQSQNIHSLEQYISVTARKTDFHTIKENCFMLTKQINEILLRIYR